MIGLPVTALTESAAPPRASPSSLVMTTPSKSSRSLEGIRRRSTASWPVIASSTRSTSSGFVSLADAASSSISSSSTWRRPAVSTITTSRPLGAGALERPGRRCSTGSRRCLVCVDGAPICAPSCTSWSIAAGPVEVGGGERPGLRCLAGEAGASFAAAVVLPEPCRPGEQDHGRARGASASSRPLAAHQRRSAPRGRSSRPAGRGRGSPAPPRRGSARSRARRRPDDLEVDVGLEQGEADLAHRRATSPRRACRASGGRESVACSRSESCVEHAAIQLRASLREQARRANSAGSKGRRSSSFSPTPISFTGRPSS